MVMVYTSLHSITRIETGEISQLENTGTYTRRITFSGFKGSMSKEEGVFNFLELTLFAESEEELVINLK